MHAIFGRPLLGRVITSLSVVAFGLSISRRNNNFQFPGILLFRYTISIRRAAWMGEGFRQSSTPFQLQVEQMHPCMYAIPSVSSIYHYLPSLPAQQLFYVESMHGSDIVGQALTHA